MPRHADRRVDRIESSRVSKWAELGQALLLSVPDGSYWAGGKWPSRVRPGLASEPDGYIGPSCMSKWAELGRAVLVNGPIEKGQAVRVSG